MCETPPIDLGIFHTLAFSHKGSIKTLAKRAGVSPKAMYDWLAGNKPLPVKYAADVYRALYEHFSPLPSALAELAKYARGSLPESPSKHNRLSKTKRVEKIARDNGIVLNDTL